MNTDPKSIVDMGFNVATMLSFTVKEGAKVAGMSGPEIAVALAAGQMLFDIFFQLPDRTDPDSLAPSRADLKVALDNLRNDFKKDLADNTFDSELETHTDTILTINDQLAPIWHEASVTDRPRRGPLFQSTYSSAQMDSWKKEIDAFKDAVLELPAPILVVCTWIEGKTPQARRTLGLYSLAGSLWIALCRVNIAFEYIVASKDYTAAKAKYDSDFATATTAHNVWKLVGKAKNEPEPTFPVAPVPPSDDEDFFNGSVFAESGRTGIDRFIKYAEPLIKQMRKDFDARASEVKARIDAVVVTQYTGKWVYHDTVTNTNSTPTPYKALAEAQMQVYQGKLQAGLWKQLTDHYNLVGLDSDDIDTLAKTLDEWRKSLADFAPK
jgi:hypothetical protein